MYKSFTSLLKFILLESICSTYLSYMYGNNVTIRNQQNKQTKFKNTRMCKDTCNFTKYLVLMYACIVDLRLLHVFTTIFFIVLFVCVFAVTYPGCKWKGTLFVISSRTVVSIRKIFIRNYYP